MSLRGFFSIKIDIFHEDQSLNMEGYIQPPFIPTWALPSQRLKIWKEIGLDYIKSSKYQIESVFRSIFVWKSHYRRSLLLRLHSMIRLALGEV